MRKGYVIRSEDRHSSCWVHWPNHSMSRERETCRQPGRFKPSKDTFSVFPTLLHVSKKQKDENYACSNTSKLGVLRRSKHLFRLANFAPLKKEAMTMGVKCAHYWESCGITWPTTNHSKHFQQRLANNAANKHNNIEMAKRHPIHIFNYAQHRCDSTMSYIQTVCNVTADPQFHQLPFYSVIHSLQHSPCLSYKSVRTFTLWCNFHVLAKFADPCIPWSLTTRLQSSPPSTRRKPSTFSVYQGKVRFDLLLSPSIWQKLKPLILPRKKQPKINIGFLDS